jgi:hypothetical protein
MCGRRQLKPAIRGLEKEFWPLGRRWKKIIRLN